MACPGSWLVWSRGGFEFELASRVPLISYFSTQLIMKSLKFKLKKAKKSLAKSQVCYENRKLPPQIFGEPVLGHHGGSTWWSKGQEGREGGVP